MQARALDYRLGRCMDNGKSDNIVYISTKHKMDTVVLRSCQTYNMNLSRLKNRI